MVFDGDQQDIHNATGVANSGMLLEWDSSIVDLLNSHVFINLVLKINS